MLTPAESRSALRLVTDGAVTTVTTLVGRGASRSGLLSGVPEILSYFTSGSSALAADFYDDQRELARARGQFTATPVVRDRWEKIGRGLAWATEPLHDDPRLVVSRLAEIVQLETARPYRDTILDNQERDPAAVGWRRIARGDGCKLCQLLASRGAVYRQSTARFATHGNCNCTAAPVFDGQDGPEASVMQYVASKRRTTQRDRDRLRQYLNKHFPDAPG